LFVATVFLLIGQSEVQAAALKTLEPQRFSLASVSEAVSNSVKQQPSAFNGPSVAPSAGQDSRQPSIAKADLMAMEWAQLVKVNLRSISIQLKF